MDLLLFSKREEKERSSARTARERVVSPDLWGPFHQGWWNLTVRKSRATVTRGVRGGGPSLFRGEIFFSSILETLIRLFLNDIILRKCYSFKINIIKVSKIKEKIFIHYNEVFRENRYTIIMVYEFLISKILPVDNMYYWGPLFLTKVIVLQENSTLKEAFERVRIIIILWVTKNLSD